MRKKYELQIENVFGVFENVFEQNILKFNTIKSSFDKKEPNYLLIKQF